MREEMDKRADVTTSRDKSPERSQSRQDAWERLRGALKDVYAELGGGEAYLRNERENFYSQKENR